jgi:orotidine-5'-phosphate decarboxylase
VANSAKKIIAALDNMNSEQMIDFIKSTHHVLDFYKIGMQSFYKYGSDFLIKVKNDFQVNIFLDLKLHDIPNTVAGAIESLQGLPIEFLTLHLSGGQKMCESAVRARDKFLPKTKLLGVSLLTSLDQTDFKNLWNLDPEDVSAQMDRLLKIAKDSKIDGVVCSPHELAQIGQITTVCPGVRFSDEISDNNTQDQARVMSPESAFAAGASYLVMGRSLTAAKDLKARLEQLQSLK